MKFIKSLIILAIALCGFTTLFAQGLEISPVRLDFALEPGSNQAQTVTVKNTSNKPSIYTLTAADWSLDEQGNLIRQEAGQNPNSCSEWLTFTPALVELEANGSADVTVTINVPAGQAATKWSLAYITLQKEQEAPQADKDLAMGIEVSQAVGVFVTQSPRSNDNAAAALTEFKEDGTTEEGARKFVVKTENKGEKILDCNMYMVISNLETAEETKLDPITFRILPEGVRAGELALPKDLAAGSYMVAAILDYGPNYPMSGKQIQIEVK
ncbi:MAG: Fn3-like domain-containing protein [Bacteroidota bacterium]